VSFPSVSFPSSTTIWRRAYVGINETPDIAAAIRGRECVHNESNGQKYHIVLPCQIPDGQRPPARR
jgi:hypothetical protein